MEECQRSRFTVFLARKEEKRVRKSLLESVARWLAESTSHTAKDAPSPICCRLRRSLHFFHSSVVGILCEVSLGRLQMMMMIVLAVSLELLQIALFVDSSYKKKITPANPRLRQRCRNSKV